LFPVVFSFALSTRAAPAAKDHTLFVGTDLAVKHDGTYHHVVGADNDALKIEAGGAIESISLRKASDIRITKGVKLSTLTATISHVKTDSVARADAAAQLAAMQSNLMMNEEASMAADRAHGRMILASAVTGGGGSATGAGTSTAAISAAYQQAASDYAGALPGLSLLAGSADTLLAHKLSDTDATDVELSFDVSSPQPLEHAYLVIAADYEDPGKPGVLSRQISTRALARIDKHPQAVRLNNPTSIGGMKFKKFDIALFADGQEVATNLSENKMPMTADEAYQFFRLDYLASHKGESHPPVAMLMTSRSEFRQTVQDADLNRPLYATIDETGSVVAISADAAGQQDLPAAMKSALQNVRFVPALKGGSPVDGRLKFTLAELLR
jgi:hypothetical protein